MEGYLMVKQFLLAQRNCLPLSFLKDFGSDYMFAYVLFLYFRHRLIFSST
ncbi:hypothetical protein THOM_2226 [Trachipleistophora hominis]|uniref:Uncharacterized protein n=1 Tax=Trachipleistophora hominis TaxID=72359 RepID=L7JVQ9_TRAHO|nr:hypothetical protein THOM_2226 [Trachipleistophora hominis]